MLHKRRNTSRSMLTAWKCLRRIVASTRAYEVGAPRSNKSFGSVESCQRFVILFLQTIATQCQLFRDLLLRNQLFIFSFNFQYRPSILARLDSVLLTRNFKSIAAFSNWLLMFSADNLVWSLWEYFVFQVFDRSRQFNDLNLIGSNFVVFVCYSKLIFLHLA